MDGLAASHPSDADPGVHPDHFPGDDGEGPQCLVVMYHYVHDPESSKCANVAGLTVSAFAAQLDELTRTLSPTDWPSLYACLQGRGSLPRRSFLLTFDDGLADHADVVLPMLEERGLHGVFFVPGCILTSHRLLAAHAAHLLFATLGDERFMAELVDALRAMTRDTDWLRELDADAAERMYHYESPLRARLKYLLAMVLPIDVRDAALEVIFRRHVGSLTRWSRHWYLGWEDLAAMQSMGHTIGGHGFSHEPYPRLSPAQQSADMCKVAEVLNEGLGADIRPFSYPYGACDDVTRTLCRESGFHHAFTTQREWVTRSCDVLGLPRVDTIHVHAALRDELAQTWG